jgi:hypothetical protein
VDLKPNFGENPEEDALEMREVDSKLLKLP